MKLNILAALILTLAATLLAGDDTQVADARAATESWLELVDAGKYGESWDGAAALFRDRVTRAEWVRMAGAAREPFGKVGSRMLAKSTPLKSLPGVPDGEYVVLEFHTAFENKAKAVEVVTQMRDPDGTWRAAGYFVR